MKEPFLCQRQEACPVVLAACERKVMAEAEARLAKAKAEEYEARREVMNRLYMTGVKLRKTQRDYFRNRTQENLVAAKDAEQSFDDSLRACHDLGKPTQQPLIFTP